MHPIGTRGNNDWEVRLSQPAVLALEDGTIFRGLSIGASGTTVGEVVFNTAMTGYQEILTDPSYCRQIVTLTYPHIGNTGVTSEDEESTGIQAAGLIIRDLPLLASNFRSEQSLSDYLIDGNTVAIADIDTRKLTRILRDGGAQSGCIMAGAEVDETQALEQARAFAGLKGMDLAKVVTTSEPYEWTEGTWQLPATAGDAPERRAPAFSVVALDFGVKRNILRILVDLGCTVTVMPAQSTIDEVMAHAPDGVFFSNGPGDPEPCEYAITLAREVMDRKDPTVRDLSGAPDSGAGQRGPHREDEVWSSRRQSPRAEPQRQDRDGDQPEPWLHRLRAGSSRHTRGDPSVPVRWHPAGDRAQGCPGLQLPGPSRGQSGTSRCGQSLSALHRGDGENKAMSGKC